MPTKHFWESPLHYLKEAGGYFQCNDNEDHCCAACEGNIKKILMLILPIYDYVNEMMAVLPIPTAKQPSGLLSQLSHILETDRKKVVGISRVSMTEYAVSTYGLSKKKYRTIFKEYKSFKKFAKKYSIHETFYPSVSNDKLYMIPEINKILKLKGITLKKLKKK